MSREVLTDGSGGWFETKSAVLFKEDTVFDGRNQISVPTGSQWDHEYLYYTKSGNWVLNQFSNWQGSIEQYCRIDESAAVAWLIQNKCFERDEIKSLPESIRLSVQSGFASAEL